MMISPPPKSTTLFLLNYFYFYFYGGPNNLWYVGEFSLAKKKSPHIFYFLEDKWKFVISFNFGQIKVRGSTHHNPVSSIDFVI